MKKRKPILVIRIKDLPFNKEVEKLIDEFKSENEELFNDYHVIIIYSEDAKIELFSEDGKTKLTTINETHESLKQFLIDKK